MLQDALSEVTKIHPSLKLRVFVGDSTTLLKGKNKTIDGKGKKEMKKLTEEVEKKASRCQSLKMVRKERAR